MADAGLHIAVDGRELLGRRTGVGLYVRELLRAWAGTATGHRYTIVLHDEPGSDLRELDGPFRWLVSRAAAAGTRWEQTRLPKVLARIAPDAFLAPANTAPLRLPCPMVAVIHDVSFFAHPEWFSWREGWRRRWLTRATGRRARTIITVSEFSRQEIIRCLGVPRDRIELAPPGAPAPAADVSGPRLPLLLYVGSLFNRRRIPELLQAFALTAAEVPDARFVLVGDNRTIPRIDPRALASGLGIGDRVEWREYADDAARDALYDGARGFVFLSDYEGFGIPPLEALAHGAPSVVLDTPVSREVYGDAALRVPLDPPVIAQALTRLLTDHALRARLLAAGRDRLAAYSWQTSAAVVLRALERAAR